MMKDVPVVIAVSKKSARNLVKHLVQMVQCALTLIIVILTIKFVFQNITSILFQTQWYNIFKDFVSVKYFIML